MAIEIAMKTRVVSNSETLTVRSELGSSSFILDRRTKEILIIFL